MVGLALRVSESVGLGYRSDDLHLYRVPGEACAVGLGTHCCFFFFWPCSWHRGSICSILGTMLGPGDRAVTQTDLVALLTKI